jgi:hypothetical protein
MAVPVISIATAPSNILLDVSGILYSFIYTDKAVSGFGSAHSCRLLTILIVQKCWAFGLRPSSGILKTIEQNVSETGSVPVLT